MLVLGGAMTASRALRAKSATMPVVGFLASSSPGPMTPFIASFRHVLSETGYVEGQNVAIEYRWGEGYYDRLPSLAADLVNRRIDLLVAAGLPATLAAKGATPTIPIVFIAVANPVDVGVATSLARPCANITGISVMSIELTPKRLELLTELVPHAASVALLVNQNNPNGGRTIEDVQEAARLTGVQLHVLKAGTENEIETAFATLDELQAGPLVVGTDPFLFSRREQLVALAARHAVPAIYEFREFAAAGGLISYGPSITGVYCQAAGYVDKILKGTKPADLPIQQPTTFELVVNLNTARALGLTVPPSILARADEVID
jgi:putative tryptophan/tyrosine transport system substrate-binding protein